MVAGIPVAIAPAGTSLTTTEFAPIWTSSPMLTGPRMRAPAPIVTRDPTGGVPLDPLHRAAAEGDPVVEHHVVADLGGLADDDAHAVVDEEPVPDDGTGMDLDPRDRARPAS